MPTVYFQDLGQLPYAAAWDYQTALHKALVERKMANREQPPGSYAQDHRLLLVEHPPVYTLGKSGSADHLLLSEDECRARGIEFYPVNRGGDITFHGPGQIVGYPILDLECFFTDVHRYVRAIEEVIIRTLADYGLAGGRVAGYTGVWLAPKTPPDAQSDDAAFWSKNRKICAIGVHLSRWVTLHGWAFNINTPLEYFNYIVPCGIVDDDKTVTSLACELGREIPLDEVKQRLQRHFEAVFECRLEPDPQPESLKENKI